MSNPYLSQIEQELRQPSAKILKDIAKALRISAETLRAGRDPRRGGRPDRPGGRHPPGPPPDPERQKQVLIDVYRSFVPSRQPRTKEL